MPVWLGFLLFIVAGIYPVGMVVIRRTVLWDSVAVAICAFAGLVSFGVGFWIKLSQEERLLVRAFPDGYTDYEARVKALIPYMI